MSHKKQRFYCRESDLHSRPFASSTIPAHCSPHSFQTQLISSSPPSAVITHQGQRFIPPGTFSRSIVMGNESSSQSARCNDREAAGGVNSKNYSRVSTGSKSPVRTSNLSSKPQQKASNLTVLLNQHYESQQQQQQQQQQQKQQNPEHRSQHSRNVTTSPRIHSTKTSPRHDEADSASGPPPAGQLLGRSAPTYFSSRDTDSPSMVARQFSAGHFLPTTAAAFKPSIQSTWTVCSDDQAHRRCMSSKEMGTLAPPSGSPYAYMLTKKSELENSMRQRLLALRESAPHALHQDQQQSEAEGSTNSSKCRRETSNELRNRRRAEHAKAVVDDLCEVVADLFLSESKLLNPRNYGVLDQIELPNDSGIKRERTVNAIRNFVSTLPLRYALGVDTPSEVLLHMRLVAAVRSDKTKAAIHIHNIEEDSNWCLKVAAESARHNHSLRLVTISCHDATGLLEYISRLLATGGSRVLDADVMLSTEGIALDRFVVEMSGRLRLDRFADLVEAFLRDFVADDKSSSSENSSHCKTVKEPITNSPSVSSAPIHAGPLYYQAPRQTKISSPNFKQKEEIESAVPLDKALASACYTDLSVPSFPRLKKQHSMPAKIPASTDTVNIPAVRLQMRHELNVDSETEFEDRKLSSATRSSSMRERRPLVNRKAKPDLDRLHDDKSDDAGPSLDYLTVPGQGDGFSGENRAIPLIPFEEVMLIEAIGTGRVSNIYRAAWQHDQCVQMVALKVAMINAVTGDTSHIDELRREADIAARLKHTNVVELLGVAADPECFCIAYKYCEGGSLLSLLTDTTRYYEYLPIALDIANGMAYLHSRNVIHRDLKPSNILLTQDHRAKIADFGMSVNNNGQELTAETGTYRYMAPEVIRHESYSSNADVYSFGILLWQLITREIPFASMTPIQAAYAVAEGRRPEIPASTPRRLQEIILACWEQDSRKRPSFTYVAMALADYAKMAFSPANVGALTLQIANEMLATVEGNSTVNVDFTTSVVEGSNSPPSSSSWNYIAPRFIDDSHHSAVGLEIE